MKIILAHPGQQHSFKVAAALKQHGVLYRYFTAVYDKPSSVIMKLVHLIVKGDDVSKTAKRRCPALNDEDVITYYTFWSLCVIVLSRFKHTKRLSYMLDRKIADWFGIKVAKYAIKHNVDAVICFSMNETKCFELLAKRAPHIKRIVDCANSPVEYMRSIYDEDIARTGKGILKQEVPSFWDEKELKKQRAGIKNTQFFLAPSVFVKKGLMYSGVNPHNIHVIHYGTNFVPLDVARLDSPNDIVKYVYVGQVTYRKGLHYLLDVFSKIKRNDIRLSVVGGWKPNSDLIEKYKDCKNIHFYGNVTHDKVKTILCESDVFVFPSLTEGFSLSCLEAMSCGLPIICSNNAGANDVVIDGVNGFTYNYEDKERLDYLINYMADNHDVHISMREQALKTAMNNTWDNYATELRKALMLIMKTN